MLSDAGAILQRGPVVLVWLHGAGGNDMRTRTKWIVAILVALIGAAALITFTGGFEAGQTPHLATLPGGRSPLSAITYAPASTVPVVTGQVPSSTGHSTSGTVAPPANGPGSSASPAPAATQSPASSDGAASPSSGPAPSATTVPTTCSLTNGGPTSSQFRLTSAPNLTFSVNVKQLNSPFYSAYSETTDATGTVSFTVPSAGPAGSQDDLDVIGTAGGGLVSCSAAFTVP